MLSEEEKQELRELAASAAIRDEFRMLRKNSLVLQRVDVNRLIQFLTTMARLAPDHPEQKPFVSYTSVRL